MRTRLPRRVVVEALEPRRLLYAIGLEPGETGGNPVHEWITDRGAELFNIEFVQSNLFSDPDFTAQFRQGAHDEDTTRGLQASDSALVYLSPAAHHFWRQTFEGIRSVGTGGLLSAADAPTAAQNIASGGLLDINIFNEYTLPFGDVATAYRGLGHIVHLLQDMTVPAHVHNDPHLDSTLFFGLVDLTDFDPYHDYVDGVEFNTAGVPDILRQPAGFNSPASPRYLNFQIPSPTLPAVARDLRSASEIEPGFSPGGLLFPDYDPMFRLFTENAEVADEFASKNVKGEGTGPGAADMAGNYGFITDESVLQSQAAVLVPMAIRSTAEMIRYFYAVVDDEAPVTEIVGIDSTDPARPTQLGGETLDLAALVSDQDVGDSGVGLHTVKIEYREVGTEAWTTVGGGDNEATAVDDLGTVGTGASSDFVGKRGVFLEHTVPGARGKTFEIRVSAEDGAGNVTAGVSRFAKVGGAGMDLVLAIDTTSSMFDDIDAVKDSASDILTELAEADPGFRISIVLYKDFGDEYVTLRALEFTNDLDTALGAIDEISVSGGGDVPEAVLSALHAAIASDWRGADNPKRVVLFGDAPPHDPEPGTGLTSAAIAEEARNAGPIDISGLSASAFVPHDVAPRLAGVDEAGTAVDIYAVVVGFSSEAAESFGEIAADNRGEVFSAADSTEVVAALRNAIAAASGGLPSLVFADSTVVAEPTRGRGTGRLDVSLDEPSDQVVTVDYQVAGVDAVAGEDFKPASGTLTFAPGQTAAVIPLGVMWDLVSDGSEQFTVAFSNPVNATLGAGTAAGVTITDTPLVAVALDGRGRASFPVAGKPATLTLAGPGDATLVFAPGSEEVQTLLLTGTSTATSVRISGGRGEVIVRDVEGDAGDLKSLTASTTVLAGDARFGSIAKGITVRRLDGATFRAGGAVGRFVATGIYGSTVFFGVGEPVTELPTSLAGFQNPGVAVGTFRLSGKGVAFRDSKVAAPFISSATLGTVDPVATGAFGLATDFLGKLSVTASTKRKLKSLSDPASSFTDGQFAVQIL